MNIWKDFSQDYFMFFAVTLLELFSLYLMKTNISSIFIFLLYGILGISLRLIIKKKGIIEGNAIYDILGILGSSLIAFFFFEEKITHIRSVGIILALISLFLLNF